MASRLHRRYGKRGKSGRFRSNPPEDEPDDDLEDDEEEDDDDDEDAEPIGEDLLELIAPGFAAFGVTRFATYLAATQVEQRKPSWGRAAGAAVSIGAFLAAWFLIHKIKWLRPWHKPLAAGAGIAALQSILQLYLPQLGWMVGDPMPQMTAAVPAPTSMPQTLAGLNLQPVDDDPNEFTYNDAYDAGRYGGHTPRPPNAPSSHVAGHTQMPPIDMNDLAIDEAIGGAGNLGVFQN